MHGDNGPCMFTGQFVLAVFIGLHGGNTFRNHLHRGFSSILRTRTNRPHRTLHCSAAGGREDFTALLKAPWAAVCHKA